jgi:hypothetical protein
LAIIKEHLGHVTHSLNRLKTLTDELEASLGISLPDCTPWPRLDALSSPPDASAWSQPLLHRATLPTS